MNDPPPDQPPGDQPPAFPPHPATVPSQPQPQFANPGEAIEQVICSLLQMKLRRSAIDKANSFANETEISIRFDDGLSNHNSLYVHSISAVVSQTQCHMISSIVSSPVHDDRGSPNELVLFLLVPCIFL